MNGLSDSVTIGIVLALVFGALFFYLYSRLTQNEKRVSLIENMLIDLKMTFEGSWMQGVGSIHEEHEEESHPVVNHVEPVSAPEPLNQEDVDVNDEDIYKEVLEQSAPLAEVPETKTFEVTASGQGKSNSLQVTKVQPNYESMSTKELRNLVKSRGLTMTKDTGKKELIATLRKADTPSGVDGGTFLSASEGALLEEETQD